jgi:hypothetical protein
MLELIYSRNCPINSLTVDDEGRKFRDITYYDALKKLNMDLLKELCLVGLTCDQAKVIMDMALQSTCQEIRLDLHMDMANTSLIEHNLIHRATDLGLGFGR